MINHPSKHLSNRLCKRKKAMKCCTVSWVRWDKSTSALFSIITEETRSHLYLSNNGTMLDKQTIWYRQRWFHNHK